MVRLSEHRLVSGNFGVARPESSKGVRRTHALRGLRACHPALIRSGGSLMHSLRSWSLGVALVVAGLAPPPLRAQESLERQFVQQAPQLIRHLQDQGYKNVGVLKFLVARDGKPSDNAGTLNLLLARRLELALILANAPKTPVGIVENASAVAQTTPQASYLSKDDRPRLFAAKYPLAWGKQRVSPDAFVTGL